jgi:hypothetical protein
MSIPEKISQVWNSIHWALMFVRQRLMFLLEKDNVLCDVCVTLLMCSSQQRVLWMFKPRYLAELTLFSTCPWMVYLDCSTCPWMVYLDCTGVMVVVICRWMYRVCVSGWSCISHWSSHFYNVSRFVLGCAGLPLT